MTIFIYNTEYKLQRFCKYLTILTGLKDVPIFVCVVLWPYNLIKTPYFVKKNNIKNKCQCFFSLNTEQMHTQVRTLHTYARLSNLVIVV